MMTQGVASKGRRDLGTHENRYLTSEMEKKEKNEGSTFLKCLDDKYSWVLGELEYTSQHLERTGRTQANQQAGPHEGQGQAAPCGHLRGPARDRLWGNVGLLDESAGLGNTVCQSPAGPGSRQGYRVRLETGKEGRDFKEK